MTNLERFLFDFEDLCRLDLLLECSKEDEESDDEDDDRLWRMDKIKYKSIVFRVFRVTENQMNKC